MVDDRATRLSAGVVIVRDTADGPRFLLLRAYRNWDFPKGMVEPGEDAREAAIRETREETGIRDLQFAWGDAYARGKIARYFLARTQTVDVVLEANPVLGRAEHHEHRWVDTAEAHSLASPRIRPVVAWAAARVQGGAK
jgi:bis(5'-nucleosidyl)-tetraphosphatase